MALAEGRKANRKEGGGGGFKNADSPSTTSTHFLRTLGISPFHKLAESELTEQGESMTGAVGRRIVVADARIPAFWNGSKKNQAWRGAVVKLKSTSLILKTFCDFSAFFDGPFPASFSLFFFNFQLMQFVGIILPVLGFEPGITGVGSDCSTNWVTTTAQRSQGFFLFVSWGMVVALR